MRGGLEHAVIPGRRPVNWLLDDDAGPDGFRNVNNPWILQARHTWSSATLSRDILVPHTGRNDTYVRACRDCDVLSALFKHGVVG